MDDYPVFDAFLTMLWFFLWILWLFLLFRILGDVFRDDTMSGGAKAGWLLFVIVLPFLGCFVYLIARGRSMAQREIRRARDREVAFHAYAGQTADPAVGATEKADRLATLAGLHNSGQLTDAEYERVKEGLLADR
ncbi:PLD nuclease N-terminal domain-containing protein [Streptomyces sp. NPDC089799]|uniref:PLD nuclease N-terminal domain-containing protein n=1 Tax=Streptomyces sp. NPDC089799 TaxID=3155066 RepID=UPI0034366627